MALNTNFNVNPYYDDYDEDKKFLKLLFKPGYAVQARELTQLQSILQKQVERFGNHIFKNGSVVNGGATVLQDAIYIKLDSTYTSIDVDYTRFENKTILSIDESKRAEVIRVYSSDVGTGDPITLLIKQIYGEPFVAEETIKTNEASPYFGKILTSGVGTGQIFSVDSGIYYYDGYFVKTDKQTIATSKYSNNNANVKIGFEVTESIVKSTSDTSLLDPAQEASNYQAPGSDRYKIEMVLSTRTLDSTDLEQFIEIARVEEGILTRDYQYAFYSVLEENLARRTYDESGNYTVKPFAITLETNSANANNMDIILSPGKGYVYGYEFETIAPTRITIDKPRTSNEILGKELTADYGYFIYTTNHYGSLPIDDLSAVDLHCVDSASINTSTTQTISNTNIGTVRIKSISFDSSSNTSNSSTYEFKTYLFDIDVESISGGVNTATSNTVSIGNVSIGQIYTSVDNAYQGAKLRITSGPGEGETPKVISNFNASTQTLTLTSDFITIPDSSSTFSIDFEFNDVKSLAKFSGTTKINSADVDSRSFDTASVYDDTFISDTNFEPIIFKLGESYIRDGSINRFQYSFKRLYKNQTFTSNVSPTITPGLNESLDAAGSDPLKSQKYQIFVTDGSGTPYANGSIVPSNKFTVDTGTNRITVEDSGSMTADIIATLTYNLVSGSPAKTKTYYTANPTIQTTGGQSILGGNVIVYATSGQTTIANTNVIKVPNEPQSLYVSDVVEIVQVLDFNGGAVSNTGGIDVTSRYNLDNGQRDSFYDHAAIKLKPGQNAPAGPLVVRYNLYTSSGAGVFTVDSYPTYEIIPTFTSPVSGSTYKLRDCLDFRPVRKNATSAIGDSVVFDVDPTVTGPKIPDNGSDIDIDYSYYVPRTDKIVLNKNKQFEVVKGSPSINSPEPKDKDDSMTLYVLNEPAYVANTSDISVTYINNKRYTMRDIGTIEKRIENLEYYTSLSLLEQDAFNKQDLTILDSTNLPRFKNGIIVDSFKGHSVSDVFNEDYRASIDPKAQELRPSFNVTSRTLTFDSANSTASIQSGPFVTVQPSANTVFVDQPRASKTLNINPFNVVNYIGKITLNPPSDVWVDTIKNPDLLVNIGGDKDAWDLLINKGSPLFDSGFRITNPGSGYSTAFVNITGGGGSGASARATISGGRITAINLTNVGSGYQFAPTISITGSTSGIIAQVVYDPNALVGNGYSYEWGNWSTYWSGVTNTTVNDYWRGNLLLRDTLQTTSSAQTRNGIATQVTPQTITQSIGDRVIDLSVIPYMREKSVLFTGNSFKPDATLYPFFDNISVEKYVGRANKFNLVTNNLQYKVTTSDYETVNIVNTDTSTVNGTAIVVKTSNNSVFVVNITPNTAFNMANANLVGTQSGETIAIASYEHYSGLTNAATSNTITLSVDATGAINESLYGIAANSNTIFIVAGTGAGQQATISSYNSGTRTITISGTWTKTPDTSSVYSIGRLRTTRAGDIAGVFTIPPGIFRVGEKLFRLTDTFSGDIPSSSTNGDAAFFAQGLLQTTETTILSTIAPTIQRTSVTDDRVVSSNRVVETRVIGWVDPLAQTFLVSPQNYPEGIFLEKVRVCFKTKDATTPVTLQLRPTVNGYPSATTIYPYGSVTLTPDQVNITDSPDLDDNTKYTDFTFDAPIYMQPGEHSFVLLSNSRGYETYCAEIGKLDIVNNEQISEQPYGGSLFLSQNGSTWEADQQTDMTFRIYRKRFNTSSTEARFLVDAPPNANIAYDLAQFITSQVVLANTSVSYTFSSERETGGLTGFKAITPLTDYQMNDGDGRRIINGTRGNTTLVLRATMSTLNPDITPFVDITRFSTILVDNHINNLPLQNTGFVIENGGQGFSNASNIIVTLSGGGGSGATAAANITSDVITEVYLTNQGSGYTGSPIITISGDTGVDAVVSYNGEDKKSGGNSAVRYFTRKVTLADGFDSGDLRVYLTAYKPSGSNIYVYYKILSKSDPDQFDNKNWKLMGQLGNQNFVSTSPNDFREIVFAPGSQDSPENSVTYTTGTTAYNTFRTFAIKVVLSGTNTTDVPKLRDFRAIALPAES